MAAKTDKVLTDRLARVPLFAKASKKHLKLLAQLGREISQPEGKTFVEQGSKAHAFYLILDGGVEVTRDGSAVARLHEGDFFGESAMIQGGERNASVTATTNSTFFVLSRTAFAGAVKTNPELSMALLVAMSQRQPSNVAD